MQSASRLSESQFTQNLLGRRFCTPPGPRETYFWSKAVRTFGPDIFGPVFVQFILAFWLKPAQNPLRKAGPGTGSTIEQLAV
jgi:hypothetical protein